MAELSEKDECRPFLEDRDTHCPRCREHGSDQRDRASRRWQWIAGIALVSNVLALFVAALVLRAPGRLQCLTRELVGSSLYSPLEAAVRYKTENGEEAHWQKDLYMGPPTPETEQAWDDLTQHPRPVYFHAPDAQRLGFQERPNSGSVRRGSFAVSVGVFHNLHCLRSIRMSYYEDYFFANWTQREMEERREHNLHCLEAIRSSIVCSADTTAYPLLWKDGQRNTELVLDSEINRRCVDLEAIRAEMGRFSLVS